MSKKSTDGNSKLEKSDALQAIIFADDFTTRLSPVENVVPSLLVPVLNAPLVNYLMETLIASRVQEVIIYCSNHVDVLRNYVLSMERCQIHNMHIELIISEGCRSLGDALRDIDTKGVIRGDFILIRGDAFTNVDLRRCMNSHRKRAKQDPGTCMTLLMGNFGNLQNSALSEEMCLTISNSADNKLLFFKKMEREKKIKTELQWFLDHENVTINTGLLDSHVYFCSPAVLPLFADNFDFQTMEDFIKGVVMNEEILNSRIYWESLISTEYALPITSWKTYHKLSADILQRQAFPLSLDLHPFFKDYTCLSVLKSTFKHQTAHFQKGSSLRNNSIIGQNSSLGKNVSLIRTVIGDNCKVGDEVKLENCYVFSDVTIGNKSLLKNCVILQNSILKESVSLNGCIVADKIKLSKCDYSDKILDEKDGRIVAGDIFDPDFLEPGEDFPFFSERENLKEEEDSSEDSMSEASYVASLGDDVSIFLSEVMDSLSRGYQEKLNCENLILEINSSRYAYNMGIREVTYNVLKAILGLPTYYFKSNDSPLSDEVYMKTLKGMLRYFKKIIVNYMKTEDAQEDCLRAIEDVASTTKAILPFIQYLMHFLYDVDVLCEEKIIEWYNTDLEETELNNTELKKAVEPFVKWLEEAEEDSDSDES